MWHLWNRSTVTVLKQRERNNVMLDQWEQETLKKLTKRGTCRDIGSRLWCITCVPLPETLVVRDDSLSAGTVSLMVVFTVLSTGALSGGNGLRRLFITVSHRWILQGCFCSVLCLCCCASHHWRRAGQPTICACLTSIWWEEQGWDLQFFLSAF